MTNSQPLLEKEAAGGNAKGGEEAAQTREMNIGDGANAGAKFANNAVSTAKYSFIPLSPHFLIWKNLFEQFHKAANLYFLLISALQVAPWGLSPTGRFTTLAPLSMVLTVTMIKDAYEDYKRHRSDAELNSRETQAWRNNSWQTIPWKDLKTGDICRVKKGHSFPADIVLIWSPDVEGMCYIETANLDGETNLKIRKSPQVLYKMFSKENPGAISGGAKIVCELPNNRLYNYDGFYEQGKRSKVPLSADNLLLRGANLRNTHEIIGIVVFTGPETKLMQNSTAKSSKMSQIDHITNRQVLYVFLLQIIMCVGCTIGAAVVASNIDEHWYIPSQGQDSVILLIPKSFGTFLILYNNLIPISLYVTMETVKLIQTVFINSDIEMYHEDTDIPATARTSSLNEELGQVEYIFSDKTGTLTCNMMDFLKFTCSRFDPEQGREVVVSYGTGTTEIGRAAAAREGRALTDDRPPGWAPTDGFFFYDHRVNNEAWRSEENADRIEFFLTFLAVCHAVIPEKGSDGNIIYQAASPDEGCLVTAAKCLGVEFIGRTEQSVTLKVFGQLQTWDILNVIEFDSARKRMTVICQEPGGRLLLLMKGADTVMYERLRKERSGTLQADTLEILTKFAAEGLRTLVLGKVDLEEGAYNRWAKKYHEASTAIVDRKGKMAAVAEEIERDLDLVGATAIEDKLQDKVPATIELLMNAGIKVWVLTGDKQETAVNIGFACALLHNEMGLFMFNDCTRGNIGQVLQSYLSDAKLVHEQDLGLVIEGGMLEHILPGEEETLTMKKEAELFLCLATRCKAVICCRVSPLQKASVVMLVKKNIHCVTLAIGDGANDVSMIQAAHVGIGIQGLEGLQAARAADYSIGQFRFLQRLLLVHGRYSYRRISKLILYCFYKNISLYLTQFWFALFNKFTGQSLYDQWALSLWNVAFTSVPIVGLASLDRDVNPERILSKDQFPELYHDGMKNLIFNTLTFWMFTGNAIFHSLLCFIIPLFATQYFETADGFSLGLVGTGATAYTTVLLVVSIKISLEAQLWTVPFAVLVFLSVGFWYVFLGVYGEAYNIVQSTAFAWWYGLPAIVLSQPTYWFTVIITATICLIREVCWKTWKHNYSQKLHHIVQEFEARGKRFTRKDVVNCAPHLLPKFAALKPYEPNREEGSIFAESEMSVVPLLKSVASTIMIQDQAQKEKETSTKPQIAGNFFAPRGKVKMRDIVVDDDAL